MDREAVRNAFATELASAEFNALLESIWVEKGEDPLNVLYPYAIHPTVLWSPQQFPCGEVLVSRGSINNPDRMNIDYTYAVTVFWHANGSDEVELENQLDRLIRATQDFYKAKPTLHPTLAGVAVWLGDDDSSPLIRWGEVNRPLVKSMSQDLFVRIFR